MSYTVFLVNFEAETLPHSKSQKVNILPQMTANNTQLQVLKKICVWSLKLSEDFFNTFEAVILLLSFSWIRFDNILTSETCLWTQVESKML